MLLYWCIVEVNKKSKRLCLNLEHEDNWSWHFGDSLALVEDDLGVLMYLLISHYLFHHFYVEKDAALLLVVLFKLY